MTRIYHNPRCSKSRQTLALLEGRGEEPEVVLYLNDPLDREQLAELCRLLELEPAEIVRVEDPRFKALGLARDEPRSQEEWLDLLAEHPVLMQRPIVVHAGRAAIGRPPERVLELF